MPKLIMQKWIERDSWNGPQELWPSFHLTEEDRKLFVREVYGERSITAVPECYTSVEGPPQTVEVEDRLYRRVKRAKKKGKFGIHANIEMICKEKTQ